MWETSTELLTYRQQTTRSKNKLKWNNKIKKQINHKKKQKQTKQKIVKTFLYRLDSLENLLHSVGFLLFCCVGNNPHSYLEWTDFRLLNVLVTIVMIEAAPVNRLIWLFSFYCLQCWNSAYYFSRQR